MTVTIKCSIVEKNEWENKDGLGFTITEQDYQGCLNTADLVYKAILKERNLGEDEFRLVTLLQN